MATFKNTTMPSRNSLPMRSGGGSRILRPLMFLTALVAVAGASVATTWMITTRMHESSGGVPGGQPASGPQATPMNFVAAPSVPPAVPTPIFFELAPFTVTVQGEDTERILHVGLTLRVADDQSRLRLEKYLPEVRSRVLMELSRLKPEDLQGAQGRVDLAAAIARSVNRPFTPLPDGQYVTDVLFTAFVVQ